MPLLPDLDPDDDDQGQTHHDAGDDTGHEHVAHAHAGDGGVDHEGDGGRDDDGDGRGRRHQGRGEGGGEAAGVDHGGDQDDAQSRHGGRAGAGDGAEEHGHDDADDGDAALLVAHAVVNKADQALGDARLGHHVAGDDKEGDGQQQELGHAVVDIGGDDGELVVAEEHGKHGGEAQAHRDGGVEKQQDEEAAEQNKVDHSGSSSFPFSFCLHAGGLLGQDLQQVFHAVQDQQQTAQGDGRHKQALGDQQRGGELTLLEQHQDLLPAGPAQNAVEDAADHGEDNADDLLAGLAHGVKDQRQADQAPVPGAQGAAAHDHQHEDVDHQLLGVGQLAVEHIAGQNVGEGDHGDHDPDDDLHGRFHVAQDIHDLFIYFHSTIPFLRIPPPEAEDIPLRRWIGSWSYQLVFYNFLKRPASALALAKERKTPALFVSFHKSHRKCPRITGFLRHIAKKFTWILVDGRAKKDCHRREKGLQSKRKYPCPLGRIGGCYDSCSGSRTGRISDRRRKRGRGRSHL